MLLIRFLISETLSEMSINKTEPVPPSGRQVRSFVKTIIVLAEQGGFRFQ